MAGWLVDDNNTDFNVSLSLQWFPTSAGTLEPSTSVASASPASLLELRLWTSAMEE